MKKEIFYKLLPQILLFYSLVALIFVAFRIFTEVQKLNYIILIILLFILVYALLIFYFFKKGSFLPIFNTDSKLISRQDSLETALEKTKNENRKVKNKLKTVQSEKVVLEQKLSVAEKRLRGEYKFGFYFNSDEHEKLTDKIHDMLKNSVGKSIRLIGLVDGLNKADLLRSLEEGNLKILLRKVEDGKNVIPFCKTLNEKGKSKKWILKKNENIHGRILIVGNDELIVLTTDLVQHMHSRTDFGLWTNDKSIIQEAIDLFERLYNSSQTENFSP